MPWLAIHLPLLSLAQLRGRVTAGEHAGGLDLAIEQLAFTTDDGVPWAPNTVRLALQRDPLARVDPADPLAISPGRGDARTAFADSAA